MKEDDLKVECVIAIEQGDDEVFDVSKTSVQGEQTLFHFTMLSIQPDGTAKPLSPTATLDAYALLELSCVLRQAACEQLDIEDAAILNDRAMGDDKDMN